MPSLLRTAAVIACALVALGFVFFTTDEARTSSDGQVAKIANVVNQPAPSSGDEQLRERQHGQVRELVDDANDVLLAPFADLVAQGGDPWVQRAAPSVLALLVYGLGLTLLANFLPKPRSDSNDWRDAGATR